MIYTPGSHRPGLRTSVNPRTQHSHGGDYHCGPANTSITAFYPMGRHNADLLSLLIDHFAKVLISFN